MRPLSYARHRVTGTRNRAACITARRDVKFINAVVQLILSPFFARMANGRSLRDKYNIIFHFSSISAVSSIFLHDKIHLQIS